MEDDLISSLTRQVKEEVIENYLQERRILELQIEDLHKQADQLLSCAHNTGRRLSRLAYLMIHPEMMSRLVNILKIPPSSFWSACMEAVFSRRVQFIRVRALTERARFRKLMIEAYSRLYRMMEIYRQKHESLRAECRAVNRNIEKFQKNFDLLTILSFLRTLDMQGLERKNVLGENFTPAEMASLDQKLYVRPVAFESLAVPEPLVLPRTEVMETILSNLAQEIYLKHKKQVRRLLS
ncbi:MAG: hypothetical protein HPY84_04190 [Syntrophobacteraceae bacterium]|nr:hypothetical protein [Syntrophobacteraceae bacterium]